MGDTENSKIGDTPSGDLEAQIKATIGGDAPGVVNAIMNPSSLTDPMVLEAIKSQLKNHPVGICTVPKHLRKKVKALKKLHLNHTHLEASFFCDVHELEMKYEKLYEPLYEKRKLIVSGAVIPTEEECDFPSDSEKELNDEMDNMKINATETDTIADNEVKDVKGIPGFWLTAFKNASVVADIIEEHDEPILKHLLDVKITVEKDPMAFLMEFVFEPNEYFPNEVLTKYYEMKCEPDPSDPFTFDGPEIVKSKGCTIDWKKGMNVTVKTIKKKQKHKARGAVRMVTRTVQNDSFFNFFNPPTVSLNEQEEDDMDEDQRNTLAADFEIGNYIKEHIIPDAVLYFTGENLLDDDFDEEDDEEDEEEYDEDEEESENETGSQLVKQKKNPVSQQLGGSAAQPSPPECHQQ